ncbi:MAG: TVP38/TMEM64 family protein [Clostridia bacterium]|nr:TVP38/TMEM64 family protein [Clostridia bacterium]
MKKNTFKLISTITYVAAMVLLTAIAFPLIKSYDNPDDFIRLIDSFGIFGFIVMLFIQVAQVIVALIPGEIVEFVAGTLYGWFGGFLFCLLGVAIGQCVIFLAVRFLGENLVEKAAGSKAMNKFKFLRDEKRLKTVIFIIYFLPGTPKDLLTYIVPLTKIKFADFMVLSLLARIPSVISSTLGGDAFAEKNYLFLAIVYSLILIISILGALIYKKWDAKHSVNNSKDG